MAESHTRHSSGAGPFNEGSTVSPNWRKDCMDATAMDSGKDGSQHSPRTDVTKGWVLPWLGLVLLLAVQYGMFRQYAEREVTWHYPRAYDQVIYLIRSYQCYEQILTAGPWRGVWSHMKQPVPNGLVFEAQAALLYLILGPGRLTALTVNFIYFALFQIALVSAVRHRSGSWALAFLGLGLLLTAGAPFFWAGGLMDFRIDFCAFCLYGILACVVARGDFFLSWGWSAAAGLLGAWLVLTRYLCAVYVAGVGVGCVGFLLVLLAVAWLRSDKRALIVHCHRLVGALLAACTIAVLIGPVVYWKWPAIRDYYIGQFERGDGEVRAAEFGAATLVARVDYYFKSVVNYHAGGRLLQLAVFCLLVALACRITSLFLRRTPNQLPLNEGSRPDFFSNAFPVLCLAVPYLALVMFGAVSPVVGAIMVGPLILIVMCFLATLVPSTPWAARVMAVVASFILAIGFYTQASAFTRPAVPRSERAHYEEVTRLYSRLADYCQAGLFRPRIACTRVTDSIGSPLLNVVAYETRRHFVESDQTFGGTIMGVTQAEAETAIQTSDVVLMCDWNRVAGDYPFNQSMHQYRARLIEVCKEGHVPLDRFSLPDCNLILFVKPRVGVTGATSDRWIQGRDITVCPD
jgi:hypothetical protein